MWRATLTREHPGDQRLAALATEIGAALERMPSEGDLDSKAWPDRVFTLTNIQREHIATRGNGTRAFIITEGSEKDHTGKDNGVFQPGDGGR